MKKHLEAFTLVIMAVLVVFIATIGASFIRLEGALPMENFSGRIISPVDIGTQSYIEAEGSVSRRVRCTLDDFIFTLRHEDGEVIHLGPESLRKAPLNAGTYKEYDIQFEVYVPNDMTLGWWSPSFTGTYYCYFGLLDSIKTQKVMSPRFEVINTKL